ncbi:lytic murein transglycosylase [Fodinicurvata sp. EGI_FJ10296]|uniref:lytic murein transglycosylase n=1 Tax=Fodinicurvata sp. EGI_FJ10296 TaxID=3231908 RepID=UPI0034521C40
MKRRDLVRASASAAALIAIAGTAGLAGSREARADASFDTWLAAFRREAAASGISSSTLDRALDGLSPVQRVIDLDRRQPESRITFSDYLARTISDARVAEGRRLGERYRSLIEDVSAQYGVQPRFILALWGIESSYGGNTGGFSVISALATLAWEGRRGEFFRSELLAALRILDEGHVDTGNMQGSWAGAMGQSQFMPSSFHRFAVDFDGDGRRDIWTTEADVFASAANYLAQSGWDDSITWGRRVSVPATIDQSQADLDVKHPLNHWNSVGVRRADGTPLPDASVEASLLLPEGVSGPAFLVYENFRVILRWNRSTYFATSVGLLSDRIGQCEDHDVGLRCVL